MNIRSYFFKYGASIVGIVLSAFFILFDTQVPVTTVISAFASLIFIQIGLIYANLYDDISPIKSFAMNSAEAKPIRESDFYDEFRMDVQQAEQRVLITYFNNHDPTDSPDNDVQDYYREIESLTKQKEDEDVEFKRLIRGIPQLEGWVDQLIDEHEGDGNFSLACTMDDEPDKPLREHVPVQIIDDDIVYFVAVGEQQERSGPRDMFVRSEDLNAQWHRYYDRLWDDSSEIMNRGRVNDENLSEYKEHIRELKDG